MKIYISKIIHKNCFVKSFLKNINKVKNRIKYMENLNNLYIAKVLNNADPLKQERVFCRVIGMHDIIDKFSDKEYGIWINNGIAIKNFSGYIPDIDDFIYVMFVNDNDPMHAVYFGIVRHQV
jgi:hypothetical protein